MKRTVAIIQARMCSSRLPGKVMKDLCGQPMLGWVIQRARMAKLINQIVVATTTEPDDAIIKQYCLDQQVACYRGGSADVLDRYYQAARLFQADVIVRLTADCPLIDPILIDQTILAFFKSKVEFATNRLPPPFKRTYPIGLDVEVVSFSALERAWNEAIELYEREHVMPFFYEVPGRFKMITLENDTDFSFHRWTVDTPEDLKFIRQVLSMLNCQIDFTWLDVLRLVEQHPDLMQINAKTSHKTFKDVDERSKTDTVYE
jgi:spore coat polysaccharide biosynthesis protein SpsF